MAEFQKTKLIMKQKALYVNLIIRIIKIINNLQHLNLEKKVLNQIHQNAKEKQNMLMLKK